MPDEPFDQFAAIREFYQRRVRQDPTASPPTDFVALAGSPETLAAFDAMLRRLPGATDADRLAALVALCQRYGIGSDPALLVDSEPLP